MTRKPPPLPPRNSVKSVEARIKELEETVAFWVDKHNTLQKEVLGLFTSPIVVLPEEKKDWYYTMIASYGIFSIEMNEKRDKFWLVIGDRWRKGEHTYFQISKDEAMKVTKLVEAWREEHE